MMTNLSQDPRSIRARKALSEALITLLKQKSYLKITVTGIAREAGLARHTFYNHYETKDDLLDYLIDSILDDHFSDADQFDLLWDMVADDPQADLEVGIKFFKVWQEHREILEILSSVDMDCLLIDRLKKSFQHYLTKLSDHKNLDLSPELGRYLISFNAYALVGILHQWIQDDMTYSPEVMGQFLNHFVGFSLKRSAVEKFRVVID